LQYIYHPDSGMRPKPSLVQKGKYRNLAKTSQLSELARHL
jgi:hypothetical protein